MNALCLDFLFFSEQVNLLQGVIWGNIPLDVRVFDVAAHLDAPRTQRTRFLEGQLVCVTKRTEVGICKSGGVARITSVTLRRGVEFYDVSYVLDGTKEKQLSASILEEHVEHAGRPRRSLASEHSG